MKTFERGEPIKTLDQFLDQEFVQFMHKVYHRGWAHGWSIRYICNLIKAGRLYTVKRIPKEAKHET